MSDIVGTLTSPVTASVAALNALSLIADALPQLNPPVPIYAIVRSDTFLPLTLPSSWGEFSYRYSTALSDYPQETGAFSVYNKVVRPAEISVELVKSGSDVTRALWLAAIQLQETANPEQLYTLISPQGVWTDYTIADLSFATRRDKGQNLLYLSIKFQEIPQIPAAAGSFLSVLEGKSSPVAYLGQLYTQASTAAQDALINVSNFL